MTTNDKEKTKALSPEKFPIYLCFFAFDDKVTKNNNKLYKNRGRGTPPGYKKT